MKHLSILIVFFVIILSYSKGWVDILSHNILTPQPQHQTLFIAMIINCFFILLKHWKVKHLNIVNISFVIILSHSKGRVDILWHNILTPPPNFVFKNNYKWLLYPLKTRKSENLDIVNISSSWLYFFFKSRGWLIFYGIIFWPPPLFTKILSNHNWLLFPVNTLNSKSPEQFNTFL